MCHTVPLPWISFCMMWVWKHIWIHFIRCRVALWLWVYPVRRCGSKDWSWRIKKGENVQLPQSRFKLAKGKNTFLIACSKPIESGMQEHPNLYTLEVAVYRDNKELSRFDRRIGFRRNWRLWRIIMLVNGRRIEIAWSLSSRYTSTLGRTTTADLDSLDVLLFKAI